MRNDILCWLYSNLYLIKNNTGGFEEIRDESLSPSDYKTIKECELITQIRITEASSSESPNFGYHPYEIGEIYDVLFEANKVFAIRIIKDNIHTIGYMCKPYGYEYVHLRDNLKFIDNLQ